MTDAAFVFWSGVSCGTLFCVAAGALVVLSIDRKLTERVADIEKAIAEMAKAKDDKKSRA